MAKILPYPCNRICLIFFLLFVSISATVHQKACGQSITTVAVHIKPQTQTVRSILKQIEDQAGLSFVYSKSFASVGRTITLTAPKTTVKDIIDQISTLTSLQFTIDGNQVIVREKKATTYRKWGKKKTKKPLKKTSTDQDTKPDFVLKPKGFTPKTVRPS